MVLTFEDAFEYRKTKHSSYTSLDAWIKCPQDSVHADFSEMVVSRVGALPLCVGLVLTAVLLIQALSSNSRSLPESVREKSSEAVSLARRAVDVAAAGNATEKHEPHEPGDLAEPDEQEEETATPIGTGIAVTLIGSISFMMCLMYCTNHTDADMRRYSYMVISRTICIFCAVLLFQGINGMLDYFVIGEEEEGKEAPPSILRIVVSFVHMLFWYVVLQFALAILSGAVNELLPTWLHNAFKDGLENKKK